MTNGHNTIDLYYIDKQDIVNVDNVNIREAIHERYDGEIIVYQSEFRQHNNKAKIHFNLAHSAMSSWAVNIDMICVMGGNLTFGIWFRTPTFAQSSRPIANGCPPPNVWIEVFYDRDPDRSHALSKSALFGNT
ncbi:11150_t:CDS:2 [Paraglomus brasilianum]|uniref:11150_t:CDS:1 n=1 Tax=Paraglomus brasilianum TaxID=144538 RepID=A0A9N8YVC2_9GLOM|nr:11150_t:CDS:2 [Paraglomus brasilianum]